MADHMRKETTAALDALLRRAAADERFVAWALARSAPSDTAALPTRLGCPQENLPRLALCRRPADGSEGFAAGVREPVADLQREFPQPLS